jgi:hypothetical protein
MVHGRTTAAGIAARIGCDTFRATGITAYLATVARPNTRKKWTRMKARAPRSFTTEPKEWLLRKRENGSAFVSECRLRQPRRTRAFNSD